ncbi:kinase-like domain-containing protein [Rhizophagus irregularis DAOM 181602=DAOM 197198]|nr:kinase-like domain-containing protein [Rhizophagus irregularis DAOM 181602=DAOM 197198]
MKSLKKIFKKKPKPRNLWKEVDFDEYQTHVTVSSINSATKSEDIDDNLIMKCWDAKAENRPSAKELYQILAKWHEEYMKFNVNSDDVPSVSTNLISECFDCKI